MTEEGTPGSPQGGTTDVAIAGSPLEQPESLAGLVLVDVGGARRVTTWDEPTTAMG